VQLCLFVCFCMAIHAGSAALGLYTLLTSEQGIKRGRMWSHISRGMPFVIT
jgi:hypothetical protein